MPIFILIVILVTHGGTHTNQIEFNSLDNCLKAKKQIQSIKSYGFSEFLKEPYAFCVEK